MRGSISESTSMKVISHNRQGIFGSKARFRAVAVAVLCLAAMLWAGPAQAAVIYWDFGGTPTTTWTTLANWDTAANGTGGNPAAAPGALDTAYFNISTLNTNQTATLAGALSIGGLVFNSTGTTAINTNGAANRAITLGTAGLTINSGAGAVTFGTTTANQQVTFTLGGAQTWTNNSSNALTLNNNNTIANGGYLLTIDGAGNITTGTGVISGTGGLTKTGAGTLTLSAANTFTGGLNLNAGNLVATVAGGFGANTNTLYFGGGNLELRAAATTYTGKLDMTAAGAPITINPAALGNGVTHIISGAATLGSQTMTISAGSLTTADTNYGLTLSGAKTLTGNPTFTINGNGTGVGTLSLITGAIDTQGATRTLTFNSGTGASAAVVSGPFTGTAGILELAGNTPTVTVNALTTSANALQLSGSGTYTLAGASTFTGGVILNNPAATVIATVAGGMGATSGKVKFNVPGTALELRRDAATTFTSGLDNTVSGGTIKVGRATAGAGITLTMSLASTLGANTITVSPGANITADTAYGLTLSGAATLTGSPTFTVNNNGAGTGTLTLSNIISGSGYGITKNGAGTLTLSGANTFTGQLSVQDGALAIGTINNNAANGVLGNNALSVILGNAGAQTGTLRYTGVTLTAGSSKKFTMGAGGAGAFQVDNGATNLTLSGLIDGGGAMSKTGAGTLTISGANTFAGQLSVQSGTLAIGTINNDSADGVLGNNALSVILGNAGAQTGTLEYTGDTAGSSKKFTMAAGGTGAFQVDKGATTLTLSAAIDGSGAMVKTGAGTLVLSGTNSYSGGTAVSAGVLQFNSSAAIGGSGRNVTVTAGAAAFGPSFGNIQSTLAGRIDPASTGAVALTTDSSENLNFSSSGADLTAASLGAAGSVNYTGTLTPNGTTYRLGGGGGTLIMANANAVTGTGNSLIVNGSVTLSAANNYTGGTTLSAGTLAVGNNGALGSGTLTISGGTISSDSATPRTTGNAVVFTGNCGFGDAVNSGKLTFTTADLGAATRILTLNSDAEFAGVVSGVGIGLTVGGTGTLTLSGANTYSGPTTISAGTLAYGIDNAILDGTVTVKGGTMDIKTFSDTVGLVTLTSGTIAGTTGVLSSTADFAVAAGNISARLGGTTGLTKTTASTVTLSGDNTYSGTTTISAGTLVLSGSNNSAGATTLTAGSLQLGGTANAGLAGGILTFGNAIAGAAVIQAVNADQTIANNTVLNNLGTISGPQSLQINGAFTNSGGNRTLTNNIDPGKTLTLSSQVNLSESDTARTLTISGTGETRISGQVVNGGSGAGGLTKSGAGLLTLSGANTYSGTTTISAGTLAYGIDNAILDGPVTVNGGTLDIKTYSDTVGLVTLTSGTIAGTTGVLSSIADFAVAAGDISAKLGGPSGLIKTTTGTVTLSGANTYTGMTTISAGALVFGKQTSLNGGIASFTPTNITVESGAALGLGVGDSASGYFDSAAIDTVLDAAHMGQSTASIGMKPGAQIGLDTTNAAGGTFTRGTAIGNLSGGDLNSIGLAKLGAGTLILSAANTYTGVTTVSAGTLSVSSLADAGSPSNIGQYPTAGAAGLVLSGGTLQHTGGATAINRGLTLAATSTIDVNTAGAALTLGACSLGGSTLNVTGGAGSSLSLGAVTLTGNATLNPTTANLTVASVAKDASDRNLVLDGTATGNSITGAIATGAGTLTKSNTGAWTLSGTNTYTGATTLTAGTLSVGADSNLGNANPLIFNGGTLQVTGLALTSFGTHTPTFTAAKTVVLDIADAGNTFTVSQALNQTTGGLIKAGAGTLALNGANTYTGDTTVSAGTLSLGTAYLNDGAGLFVAGTATLDLPHGAADSVLALFVGGVLQPAGAYNSSNSTWLTGSGSINAGSGLAPANTYYWDGPNTGGIGNAKGEDGAGTWDTTTTANWDKGYVARKPWNNATGDTAKAVFSGPGGTATVDGAITVKDIVFDGSNSHTIAGGTLNFAPGGSISNSDNRVNQTITSEIIGSPAVNIKDYGAGNQYQGFIFAPDSGTQTLGNVLNPNNTGNTDKSGITLGGSTTGNSVASISFAGDDHYAAVYKEGSGTWTVGNVDTGTIYVNAGNLVAAGTIKTYYGHLLLNGGVFHYNNPGAYASGRFMMQGGSLDNTSGAPITAYYNVPQTWNASGFTFIGSNGANSDLNLGTAAVTLSGSPTVTIQNPATTLTIGGVIADGSNTYGLTKAGAGTLVLAGANTYKGDTTVSEGTLSLSQAYLSDAAALYIATGATLNLTYGETDTVLALLVNGVLQPAGIYDSSTSTWLTGSGSIYTNGGLVRAGTYNWDGPTTGGIGNGKSEGGAGAWSTSNANWDKGFLARDGWNNTTGDTAKAVFSGTGATVTLGEAITLKEIVFAGSSSYTISGGTLNFAPNGWISVTYQNAKHTITSAITGSPVVRVINGTTYEGLTFAPTSGTVTLGTCTIYDDPVGGDKAGFHLAGTTTGNSASKVTFEVSSDHYGTLYKDGAGTWTVGDVDIGIVQINAGTLIANGTIRVYYQNMNLNAGSVLCYNNAGAVYTKFVLNGGSLDNTSGAAITTSTYNPTQTWSANFTFIGSKGAASDLNLGTGAVTLSATRQVTVQDPATTLTIGGVISGATFGLTKAGNGTLALSGNNAYTGATTISAGKLTIASTGIINTTSAVNIGAGNFNYNSATTLSKGVFFTGAGGTLSGAGTIAAYVEVTAGNTLAPGNSAGTLTVNNNLAMKADSIYQWEFDGTNADKVVVTGNLTLYSGWKVTLAGSGGVPIGQYPLFTYDTLVGFTPPASIDYGTTGWPIAMVANDPALKQVYLTFAMPGDTNNDFVVDAADYITVKKNFGQAVTKGTNGDFNGNSTVDWNDLAILMTKFGTRTFAPGVTPEPATLGLLALGALGLLRRRRRA